MTGQWIFFDLGSTLIDETACEDARIRDTIRGSDVSFSAFEERYRAYNFQNQDGYHLARKDFQLPKGAWLGELERLYPGVPELLGRLAPRYGLGVIANQKAGLGERLREFGIDGCFRVIVGSEDAGVSKPDLAIFRLALRMAGCAPQDAVMVGDRLDNDILPAQKMGMRTIWVRQGYGAYGNIGLLPMLPDAVCGSITEIDPAKAFGGAP